jgi:hypothetical protein
MEALTDNRITSLLKNLDFSPLKLTAREAGSYLPFPEFDRKYQPDYLVEIEWKKKRFGFAAAAKAISTPKAIDQGIWQLTRYLEFVKNRMSAETYYPLLIVPYLSCEKIEGLIRQDISGIDLSGNGVFIVPGELFYYRVGQRNKFPSNAPIKNVYRGTSSLVARALLTKQKFWTVNEVFDEIAERGGRTSLGTVSKVLKALEDELLISRNDGIRLIDQKTLLNKLRENYRPAIRRRTLIGKAEDLEFRLRRIAENCDRNEVLYAVDEPQKYTVLPTVGTPTRVYTENIDKSLETVEFSETDRFPNIELIETPDSTVYFDRRLATNEDIYFTSPLQVYLEMANGGKREREAADQVAEVILNPQD